MHQLCTHIYTVFKQYLTLDQLSILNRHICVKLLDYYMLNGFCDDLLSFLLMLNDF